MEKKVAIVNINDVEPVIKPRGQKVKRLVTNRRVGSEKLMLGLAYTIAGGEEAEWCFPDREEAYYVLKGKMTLYYDKEKVVIKAGDAVFLPAGLKYREINDGKEECVYVYAISPPFE